MALAYGCMNHVLRQATLADAAEVSRLVTELGYSASVDHVEERLRRLLREDRVLVLVAESDEGLLGWVNAEERLTLESGASFEIVGLVVDARARRCGVGHALVREVESWAVTKGAASVRVRSNVARVESHAFYEAVGYRRQKTQHAYERPVTE